MSTLIRSLIIVSILVTFAASPAWAGQVTIPNNFTGGTTAVAAEVNENFDAVEDAVDDNAADITANTTAIGTKVNKTGDTMTGTLNVPGTSSLHYSSSQTRYYVISHHEFEPYVDGYDYSHNDNRLNPGTDAQFWFAQFHLPQGAVVTRIDVYSQDSSATEYVYWYVTRYNLSGSTGVQMATASGTASGTPNYEILSDTSISYNVIDNGSYWYMMRISFSGGQSNVYFTSACITYTVANPD